VCKQELARRRHAWWHGEARVAAGLAWRARRTAAGEGYGGGRPESDTYGRREAGGGTGLLRWRAVVRGGSGGQSGGMAKAGTASTGSGKAAARQERARGPVQDGAEAVGVAHMAGQSGVGTRQRNRGEGERGRRRRTRLKISERIGTLL
jgi:hypothetical protein